MLTEEDIKAAEEYAEEYLYQMHSSIPVDNREAVRLEQYESFLLVRLMEKSTYEQA